MNENKHNKYKIGLSLNVECFLDKYDIAYAGLKGQALTSFCHSIGLTHIELKYISATADEILKVFDALVKDGFTATIHAFFNFSVDEQLSHQTLKQMKLTFENIFPQLSKLPKDYPLMITVHPIDVYNNQSEGDIIKLNQHLVKHISDIIADNNHNYRLAVEIQRKSSNHKIGITYQHILDIVNEACPKITGICWDFGHCFNNVLDNAIPYEPPSAFLSKVINTHIHSFNDTTHLPLSIGKIPLEDWLNLLHQANYQDAHILEISPIRTKPFISEDSKFLEAVSASVAILDKTLSETTKS